MPPHLRLPSCLAPLFYFLNYKAKQYKNTSKLYVHDTPHIVLYIEHSNSQKNLNTLVLSKILCYMADFSQQLESFKPYQAASYRDMKYSKTLDHLTELNSTILENFNMTDFLSGTFLVHPEPEIPAINTEDVCHENKKRKLMEQSYISSINVSSTTPGNRLKVLNDAMKKNSSGKGKKGSETEAEDESEKSIHVKARRGQATDKHSLAERVRREKINTRLRSLQILVPGCYKNMGMASMLDEIINYVHSLQKQIEFLSMELAAASSLYDFNLESEVISNSAGDKIHDAEELVKMAMRGY